MNYFISVLQRHKRLVVTHPIGALLLLIVCGIILVFNYSSGALIPALTYLFAVWLCITLVDVVTAIRPVSQPAFIIKHPVKKELFVIIACTLLGIAFFCIRFFGDWEHLQGLTRLAAITLIVFAFPIALALIFLFVFKYKFNELGVNFNYWYLPLLLHLVWGGITLAVVPEKSHFVEAAEEYGFFGFIFTGILGAALSEEFSRMLFQTRIGKVSDNMFTGMFIATVLWSAMHIPVAYSQNPLHFALKDALLGVVYLIPLGFFWGYLTHRTQSLLPVILMHGFNLWGLQNF